jgi:hypothetical protein
MPRPYARARGPACLRAAACCVPRARPRPRVPRRQGLAAVPLRAAALPASASLPPRAASLRARPRPRVLPRRRVPRPFAHPAATRFSPPWPPRPPFLGAHVRGPSCVPRRAPRPQPLKRSTSSTSSRGPSSPWARRRPLLRSPSLRPPGLAPLFAFRGRRRLIPGRGCRPAAAAASRPCQPSGCRPLLAASSPFRPRFASLVDAFAFAFARIRDQGPRISVWAPSSRDPSHETTRDSEPQTYLWATQSRGHQLASIRDSDPWISFWGTPVP